MILTCQRLHEYIYLTAHKRCFARNQALLYVTIAIAKILAAISSHELFYSQVGLISVAICGCWFKINASRVILIDELPYLRTADAE